MLWNEWWQKEGKAKMEAEAEAMAAAGTRKASDAWVRRRRYMAPPPVETLAPGGKAPAESPPKEPETPPK